MIKMETPLNKTIFIIISFILFISTGCMQNAEEKINRGIELYNNKEIQKANDYIEDGLIKSALIKKLSANKFSYGENVIYYRKNKTIKIIWPLKMDIESDESYNLISYDRDSQKLGLSNGHDIKIYNSGGNLLKTYSTPQDEQQIKAFIFNNEKIYYYKDKKIFLYDMISEAVNFLASDKLSTSFGSNTYNVKLYKTDSLLGIISGIGGSYYLNIWDLNNNLMILQNVSLASSKLFIKNNEVYYINGDAGKYSCIMQTISSKKIKILSGFSSLSDIEFFSSGLLYEDKEGLGIIDYGKANKLKIPFHYGISGQCCGNPVLKSANGYYIINGSVFLEKINFVNNIIPELFR